MKKIVCLLAMLLLCRSCACAETIICRDYKYTVLEDGTAQIIKYVGTAEKIEIPDTLNGIKVTVIGNAAFANLRNLTSVTIPDSITTIGEEVFSRCSSLASVDIPDSVMTIGHLAFNFCSSLTSINIPDSVTTVGDNPFHECYLLTAIEVSPNHPALAVIDGVLFDKREKQLITYPCAFTNTSYEIPQGTKAIGVIAFGGCESLESVSIPNSVSTICDYTFVRCESLANITIPDSVTSIGNMAFNDCYNITLTVGRDSYAKQYVIDNGINYTFPDSNN